jgi:hypothetical protein
VACQQVLPVQTTAADAFIAEKARTPAPRAPPNNALVNDVIFYSVLLSLMVITRHIQVTNINPRCREGSNHRRALRGSAAKAGSGSASAATAASAASARRRGQDQSRSRRSDERASTEKIASI